MKKALAALGIVVTLAGAGLAGAWLWNERATRDVRGSDSTEFVVTEAPGATTRPEEDVEEEPWPIYGYDLARTRFAPEFDHRPPFRRLWMARGRQLIEFPPVIAYGRLYFGNSLGEVFAVDAETGDLDWKKEFRTCIAASPTVGDGVVYQPLMNPCKEPRENKPGYMVALDAETGRERWRFRAGVVESSPLLVGRTLYFGSFDDKLYALDVRTRRPRWAYKTGGDVKGAPAYANGTVYTGAYDGSVYALDARTGKLRWSSEGQAGLRGAGNFYAGPAVAYGRVYIGNTDGKVYAFGARTGNLLWSKSTGGYIYSSAAVFERTVYVGSYDERFYALDAATGEVRWSFRANGPISGSPTVLGGIVYFSTLEGRTYGLDAGTGRRAFMFRDGQYTPVVADDERVYLVGYSRVYGLEPVG